MPAWDVLRLLDPNHRPLMQQPSLSWNKKKLNTKKSRWRNNIEIDLKRVIKSSEYLDLVSKFEFYADQTNNRWAFLARAWWILLSSDVDDVVEKKITSSEYHDLVTKFGIMETKPRTRWTEISINIFKNLRNLATSNSDEYFDHYTGNYGCDTKCELF